MKPLVLVSCSGSYLLQLSVPNPRAIEGFSPALPGSGSWGTQKGALATVEVIMRGHLTLA